MVATPFDGASPLLNWNKKSSFDAFSDFMHENITLIRLVYQLTVLEKERQYFS